jgi:uncharacterized protein
MIPTVRECFVLMVKYGMLDNIKAHSIMVEKVATLLAQNLADAGEKLRLDVVTAGALIHDIGKTICLNSSEDHAKKGKEICIENQLHEIADIVAEHIILAEYDPNYPVREKELVYYADKRVNHDKIVSLEERVEYLLTRYGRNQEWIHQRIRDNFKQCKEVEKKIFSKLSFKPGELDQLIE